MTTVVMILTKMTKEMAIEEGCYNLDANNGDNENGDDDDDGEIMAIEFSDTLTDKYDHDFNCYWFF